MRLKQCISGHGVLRYREHRVRVRRAFGSIDRRNARPGPIDANLSRQSRNKGFVPVGNRVGP
jgi:hypothetical protein